MPRISVILPVYNGERFLREAIESVIRQSFEEWELIIVDDCSNDSTPDIINDYVNSDERIRSIRNEINCRMTKSLNRGFRMAKGEYFTWTSDDNVLGPDMLKTLFEFLENHKSVGMVYSGMDVIDEEGNTTGYIYNDISTLRFNDCLGGSFLYRRECMEQIGEYDERFSYTQDYEYWMRIAAFYRIQGIDEPLYSFRVHKESQTEKKSQELNRELYSIRMNYLEHTLKHIEPHIKNSLFLDLCAQMPCRKEYFFEKFYPDGVIPKEIAWILKERDSDKKRYVIWGTGEFGEKSADLLGQDNIAYFVDNNKEKWGKKCRGIIIRSPKDFFEEAGSYTLFLSVGSLILPLVVKQITDEGIEDFGTYIEYAKRINEDEVTVAK